MLLYMCPHAPACVLIVLHPCPHTPLPPLSLQTALFTSCHFKSMCPEKKKVDTKKKKDTNSLKLELLLGSAPAHGGQGGGGGGHGLGGGEGAEQKAAGYKPVTGGKKNKF